MRAPRSSIHRGHKLHQVWSLGLQPWLSLLGLASLVAGLSGCGAGSSVLPGSLSPGGGGGFFSITTTKIPDSIAGRPYTATAATSAVSPTFVTACLLSGNVPSGMTAAASAVTCTLGIPSAPTAGTYNFTLTARDNTNPPKTDSRPYALVIRSEFQIIQQSLAAGVQGRTYGVATSVCAGNAPCVQPVQTNVLAVPGSSDFGQTTELGNGPLTACSISVITPSNPGLQAVVDPTDKNRCLLQTTGPVLAAAGTYSVTITATDSPIQDPVSLRVAVPPGTQTKQLLLAASGPLALTVDPTSADLGGQAPPAVQRRSYGNAAAGFTPLVYDATGGLGGYQFSLPASIAAPGTGLPAPLACSTNLAVIQATCTTGSATITAAPGSYNFSIVLNDTANTATPNAVASVTTPAPITRTLTLNAPLALALPSDLSDPLPNGVAGRSYGQGNGCTPGPACTPLFYTASNGLGGYTFSTPRPVPSPGSAFPAGFTCTPGGATFTCSALAVTGSPGPYTQIPVTLDDTANTSTPSGSASMTTATATRSLTISPALSLMPNSIGNAPPSGVRGRSYGGPGFTPLAYTASGGFGTYSFTPPGSLPAPMSCAFVSPAITCSSPNAITASPGTYTFTVKVGDTSNLTTPGGSASSSPEPISLTINPEMTFSVQPTVPFPNGVLKRPYGQGSGCGGGVCQPLTYSVPSTSGLGGFHFNPNNFPTNFVSCTQSSNTLNCSSPGVTATPGSYSGLNATVSDTANAAVASNSVVSNMGSVNLVAEMTITSPSTVPAAVVGRRYGTGTGCTGPGGNCAPLTYTVPAATPGLGGYSFTPNNFPAGFTCPTNGNNGNCQNGSVPAGTFTVLTVTVTDTPNGSVPSNSVTSSATSMPVNPEMSFSSQPPSPFVTGVAGRRYGIGMGCSGSGGDCSPLTYSAQAGSGLLPFSYSFTPNSFPPGFTCPTSGNSGNCSATAVGAAGNFNGLTVVVTDTASGSVPAGSVTSSPAANMVVNPEMSLPPPSNVPVGVVGRRYGTGIGCSGGNCAPLSFTVPSNTGLGNTSGNGYTFAPNNFPPGFTCLTSGNRGNCQNGSVGGPAGLFPNVSISVSDLPNASVPSNSVKSSPPFTMQVSAEMTLPAPSTVPVAVAGRRYGTGTGCSGVSCAPLTFTVPTTTPGLGGYSFTPINFPAGFSCPASSNNGNCQDSSVGGPPGTFAGLTVNVADIPNQSTPSNTITSSPATTLQVNAEMTVSPPSTVPNAVVGRRYGTGTGCSGGNCTSLIYSVPPSTPGLGNTAGNAYSFAPNGLPSGFACPTDSTILNDGDCQASSVGGSSGSFGITVTARDKPNTSTPSGSVTSSPPNTMVVDAGIDLAQSLGTTWPDGAQGRTYGAGSECGPAGSTACSSAVYTASNGLGGYVWPSTPPSFPTGLTCTPSGATYTCTAPGAGITGSPQGYTPSVTVADTPNVATPAATTGTDPNSTRTDSLTVDAPLAIGSQAPPNGLVDLTYSLPSGFQLTTTGGLTGLTWLEPGSTPTRACTSSPTGTLPPGLAVGASTGLLSGTPTTASSSVTDYTFQVCVTDTANATTPAGFALPPNPPFAGNNYLVNVMDTLAYVAEPGLNSVEVIRTSNSIGTVASVATGAGTAPDSVALTPNGRQAYVTLANNKFAVIDTITNAQITGSPFSLPAACTAPLGAAISPDGTRVYFACSTSNKVVVISTTDNTTVLATITAAGTPTPTTPDSVAFKSDGTRAYVTFSGTDQLVIIDNTVTSPVQVGTAFALTAANTTPLGIALATNGTKTYAYVAKQNPGAAKPGAVDVVDITSDTLSVVKNLIVGGNNSQPDSVAVTPDETRVFVTLTGADQFAVIDNTLAMPAPIAHSPFNLPDPTMVSAASAPIGVAIPPLTPVPASGFRVFISRSAAAAHDVAIIDASSPRPTKDSASPISLTLGAVPSGIASIPPPK